MGPSVKVNKSVADDQKFAAIYIGFKITNCSIYSGEFLFHCRFIALACCECARWVNNWHLQSIVLFGSMTCVFTDFRGDANFSVNICVS